MTRRLTVPRLTAVVAMLLLVRPAGAFFGGGGSIKERSDAPVFRGQTLDNREIETMFNAMVLPTTLLIDREGVVREVHLGFAPSEERRIEDAVRRLLAEPPATASARR